MSEPKHKPLMRTLGEFVGYIVKAVKTDSTAGKKVTLNKKTQQEKRGNVTLRRTTIAEIEIQDQTHRDH